VVEHTCVSDNTFVTFGRPMLGWREHMSTCTAATRQSCCSVLFFENCSASVFVRRVGQNHTFLGRHGARTVFS